MEKVRLWVSLAIAFLLSVTVVSPIVTGATTPGGIPCNEFRPNAPFGVLTGDPSKGDKVANDLLSEAGTLGLMGRFIQTNDTVAGRFVQFVVNDKNKSIDSYAAWSNGALYQVFDTIMFYDATSLATNITGPVFNGTFDKTNIRIQNHPDGVITISTEKSVRIKLTMSGGINSGPVNASTLNKSFDDAMYVGSANISSIVMVRLGSLMMAGERSIIVDLAKGGELVFRAAQDTSKQQSTLLDEILKGSVLTEYWTMTRDDGAIYSVVSYNNTDYTSSTFSIKFGSWTLKLPRQVAGHVVLFHTDKMSVTIAGGAESMLSINGSQPVEVNNIDQIYAMTRNGGSTPTFYQSATGSSAFLALFVPGDTSTTEPIDTGDKDTGNKAALSIPTSWLIAGGIVAIGAVAAAALLVRRARKK